MNYAVWNATAKELNRKRTAGEISHVDYRAAFEELYTKLIKDASEALKKENGGRK